MKIKPLLFDRIQTTHTSFEVEFFLENNITFIVGDSGTGKSAVYNSFVYLFAENGLVVVVERMITLVIKGICEWTAVHLTPPCENMLPYLAIFVNI